MIKSKVIFKWEVYFVYDFDLARPRSSRLSIHILRQVHALGPE